ncbi:MAG: PulJ/GspJ family protein [Gemmatimonadales bacterium]
MTPRTPEGFTLLEVVVALGLVGSVAVASLSALDQHFRLTRRGADVATATALATDRLDALRREAMRRTTRLPDSLRNGRFAKPLDRYSWEAELRPVSDRRGLVDIAVTVRWEDGSYPLASRVYVRPRPGRAP